MDDVEIRSIDFVDLSSDGEFLFLTLVYGIRSSVLTFRKAIRQVRGL